jgi:Na+-driven multidrug efflux pump
MKILGVGTVLNIILDPIFIIVLDLEVAGAAIATVISNGVVAISFMYFLVFKKVSYVKISFKKDVFKFDFEIIKKLFRLGIPASLSFAIMSIGIFANNIILDKADENIAKKVPCSQYLENQCSTDHYNCVWETQTIGKKEVEDCYYKKGGVIAGFTAASRLENLIMIPIIALSSSLVTMIGMFYGANRHDLIRSTINYAMRWAVQISLIFGAIFFIFSPFLLSIFTNDQKVISEGVNFFNIVSFSLPFVAISMITCRAMQGMDRPNPFLFLTLFRVILFAIPMAWIGVEYFEKETEWVWWAVLLSSIISALAGLYWMNTIITHDEAVQKESAIVD